MVLSAEPNEVKKQNMPTLEEKANVVLTGKITSVNCELVDKVRIISTVTAEVQSVQKGNKQVSKTVTFWYWGGEVGEIGHDVLNMPGGYLRCKIGDTVKLYLRESFYKTQGPPYEAISTQIVQTEPVGVGTKSYTTMYVPENFGWGFVLVHWWDTDEVEYNVNPNTADMAGDSEGDEVEDAFDTWTADSLSDFTFTRGDDTNQGTLDLGDGENSVFWDSTKYIWDPTARCERYYNVVTDEMYEFDIWFNDEYDWVNGAQALKQDVQNVATHEAGHALGLNDVYRDSSATMYYDCAFAETKKRSLASGDQAGIRYLHPDYNVPSVTISDPYNGETFYEYSYMDIEATSSVSGGSITEAKYKVTSQSTSYDSGWSSLTLSGGAWIGSWYTGSQNGDYYVSVRTKSNNGIYGYEIYEIEIDEQP
jgi:hypothetical protein